MIFSYSIHLNINISTGGFPYANISDAQLMTHLLSGNRLARPENVSEKLYEHIIRNYSVNLNIF